MFRKSTTILLLCALTAIGFLAPKSALANVPIRVSVKFILDMNGNRGSWAGTLISNAAVQQHFDRADQILTTMGSEFEVELVNIADVAGAQQHFSTPVRDVIGDLRDDARDNRTQYGWREDAINLYITGASSSGVANTPGVLGKNDIIVMGQGPNATTLMHEIGHIVDLEHTFDSDHCNDTIDDREPTTQTGGWDQFDIALDNFGIAYDDPSLPAEQKLLVDQLFGNIMSYHNANNRFFFSHCQMNRTSSQAWSDRDWLVSRRPLYVNGQILYGSIGDGAWGNSYGSLDQMIEIERHPFNPNPELDGAVVVLIEGDHSMSLVLSGQDIELVTRRGPSTIHQDVSIWDDPPSPELPDDPALATAMRDLQAADRAADSDAAIEALLRGESLAAGTELEFVRYKLAQRLRFAGRLADALERYEAVARESDDAKLREAASHWAARVQESLGTKAQQNPAYDPPPHSAAPSSPIQQLASASAPVQSSPRVAAPSAASAEEALPTTHASALPLAIPKEPSSSTGAPPDETAPATQGRKLLAGLGLAALVGLGAMWHRTHRVA